MAMSSQESVQLAQQDANANAQALHMNDFPLDARPTCPAILIPYNQQLYSLPIAKMNVQVEFNVSTAFVRIEGSWNNIAPYPSDCMFALPLHGTVTKVNIRFSERELETIVIPRDLADQPGAAVDQKHNKDYLDENDVSVIPRGGNSGTEAEDGAYQTYIPNLFRLPISNVQPEDTIHISVVYLEPLTFSNGAYNFVMPLKFGESLMPENKTLDDVLSIRATINDVSPYTTWECKSYHEMVTVSGGGDPHIELVAQSVGWNAELQETRTQSENFHLAYTVSARDIIGTLILDDTKTQYQDGTFTLFVTPPSFDESKALESKRGTKFDFPVSNRRVVFLVDRSGSMTGDPYVEAIRALQTGMETLNPEDSFTVVCFDHEMIRFTKQLQPATPENIERACTWASAQVPKEGGTNIFTPLEWSLNKLNDLEKETGGGEDSILPFVVLVTDGCVDSDNERNICRSTLRMIGNTRLLTFGIGFYCNWYFLKMLAQIGRGFSDVVVYKDNIFPQMTQLMRMASYPVLTNIVLDIPGVDSVEMYPFPVPDLFMGAPLTLAGKYRGRFPKKILIHGKKANGEIYQMQVAARRSDVIPVAKVFLKQRIDILTARAWLRESKQLANEVTDLSCRESMPCPYTTMVAYERKAGSGGDDEKKVASKDRPWYRDRRKIAALTGGALVVVPAVAFSFGNVAASGANIPVLGDLDVFGGGCCDCCGDCDCGDILGCLSC